MQRIEAGKHKAKAENRRAGDNDIRTACQDACVSDAIVFGDLNNPESRVAKLAKHPRGFTTLEELNTRPAITYLSKVRNRPAEKKADAHANAKWLMNAPEHQDERCPVRDAGEMSEGDQIEEKGQNQRQKNERRIGRTENAP